MRAQAANNLPRELTSFVGRRRELAQAKQLLSGARLTTMIGPGGVGKTRMARRVADAVSRAFRDGAWMVLLADLDDGALVPQAFMDGLGLRDESIDTETRLIEFLADKQLLLVVDNCEHLLDPCAKLLARILSTAPDVRVLATSRQVLGVEGEQVLPVPPLSVPSGDGENADLVDAVALLTERAKAADPDFRVTDQNRRAIGAICRRLEGIPLALELAALRFRVVSPEQVLDRLDDVLHLLTTGPRTAPRRQQTIDAAIRWSHDLCSERERRLWQQLSVFAGGFDLDAVESVCTDGQRPDETIIDALAALVDKSIISVDQGSQASHSRYRMLEPLRQFGFARLSSSGAEIATKQRHRDHYQRLAERGRTALYGPGDVEWFREARREHANLRAALAFSLSETGRTHHALEIAAGLRPFWQYYGFLPEGYRWYRRALDLDTAPTIARARALAACSSTALLLLEKESAAGMMKECVELATRLDATDVLAQTTLHAAVLASAQAELKQALDQAELSVRQCRAASDPFEAESLSTAFGFAFILQHPRAGEIARSFLDLTNKQGSHLLRGLASWCAGVDHWRAGDQETAAPYLREAVELFTLFERPAFLELGFDGLVWTAASAGDYERAARLMGAAHALGQRSTWRLTQTLTRMIGDDVERQVRSALNDRAFATAFDRGTALPLGEAVEYALGRKPAAVNQRHEPEQTKLTRRERDVARLVAAGLSNKQIADELVISVRTAEAHVEHILAKMAFRSRTQIAAWHSQREK